MKRLFTIFATLLATLSLSANNVVTLTVSGHGATKKEATANALRSAIEQAYGVFVSANTIILNDELVRDEIATIASGNIQKYEELSCATMPSGEMLVTLSATVAIDKLQSYAKSHGSTAEFAGQTFAMNMKMRELNKKNEQVALTNMFYHLQELAPHVFDWQLNVGEPVVNGENYEVPMCVTAIPNEASNDFYNILTNTLKSLSLTQSEVEEYKKVGLDTYEIDLEKDFYIVLRNNTDILLYYLGGLINSINSSFRVIENYASGDMTYSEMNIEPDNYFVKGLYASRVYNLAQYKMKHKKAKVSNAKKNKFLVRQVSVLVDQENMWNLQGFEVEHIGVNRFKFETEYLSNKIKKLEINQNVLPYQYSRFSTLSDLSKPLQIMSVEFGNCVSYIGENAFERQEHLEDVYIPDSVTSIGDDAFSGCSSLKSVTIGNGVTKIGDYAFRVCSSLTSITIPDSVTSIGSSAFSGCSSLRSVTIGNGVTSIGYRAFRVCSSLTSVTIGNGVTSIGEYAFEDCTSLTSITIPDSVTSIGNSAFEDCTSLTNVHITDMAAWCGIIFGGYDANPLYYAHNLYLNGELVTNLAIPDSVTSIGEYAFEDCTSLTSITIPDSVTEIGEEAFAYCSSLTSITISDSVTSIGEEAFFCCSSLASITIPDSVTSIGEKVFFCCSSLASVYCKAVTPPRGGSNMFAINASRRKIYVPTESVDAYKTAEYWCDYADNIEGYDF